MMLNISRIIFSLVCASLLLLMVGCNADTNKKQSTETANDKQSSVEGGVAAIEFDKTSHEFGQIVSGEKVSFAFRFKNTGNSPLVISNTRSGCGCTVGEYSKDPIAPGETGRVTVMFNSSGRSGFQSETIRIFTNAQPSEHLLRITAEVSRN